MITVDKFNMTTLLGSFEVTSGKIIISDPCYKLPENELANKIVNVPNGMWNAYISKHSDGSSVSELLIHHNSITLKDTNNIWLDYLTNVCVDSGQAGFFDLIHFRDDCNLQNNELATYIDIEDDGDKWYAMCCNTTYSDKISGKYGGVVPNGVLSKSGYGDGRYSVSVGYKENEQEIVYLKIHFIEESDESDDEW